MKHAWVSSKWNHVHGSAYLANHVYCMLIVATSLLSTVGMS